MLSPKLEVFLLLSYFAITSNGQNHVLKYIITGTNPSPSAPAQFNSSTVTDDQMRNTRNKFARADRICVAGMWALYNTTDYGEGAEDSTTVISVRGTDINTCTPAGTIPQLRSVQSIRFLANANYGQDGIVIYSMPSLLGGMWIVTVTGGVASPLPTGITGFSLGSLAITGTSSWVICGDRDTPCTNGVCVNMRNYTNLFLQRNPARDATLPSGWPKTVRQVQIVTADECSTYPSPSTQNNTRIVRSGASGNLDIEILTPA